MRILVTNDDGIHSPGLWDLAAALKDVGHVCVVAPDRDFSGVGTAMTLLSVLRVQQIDSPVPGVEALAVQGTPSDCVILATESLFDEPFDLLVSGINPGANMGLDVLSSGTVGGALQGMYRGMPSMAISAAYSIETQVRYEAASLAARALAIEWRDTPPQGAPLLNVNLPDVDAGGIRGVEVTRLGPRAYLENVEKVQEGRRTHYWIKHNRPAIKEPEEGTDVWAVRNHRASVTSVDLGLAEGLPPSSLDALAETVRCALEPLTLDP